VRYDADGAPRALLWSGAPGPVLRSAEDPARIHEDVEAILELARAPLGAPARGPLADLELAELVPAAASGPEGRGPTRTYARFRQPSRGPGRGAARAHPTLLGFASRRAALAPRLTDSWPVNS
jgi:hypothetical protein